MTAFTPPTAQEEIAFLDNVERALLALTTADLVGISSAAVTPAPASFAYFRTVIPAQAGTHTAHDNNDENIVAATPRGYGPPPSRG
ncbi:MAG: hypothetical protein M3Y65_00295 [Pseudomonadota bacterium]|nr:hypothetical protein [Pseudomonadota bacterium]